MKDLLPIGSIVVLSGGVKKLMIIGIKPVNMDDPDKNYDYIGVMYPEGFMGNNLNFLFYHKDIQEIVFTGYSDEERDYFIDFIDKEYKKIIDNISE